MMLKLTNSVAVDSRGFSRYMHHASRLLMASQSCDVSIRYRINNIRNFSLQVVSNQLYCICIMTMHMNLSILLLLILLQDSIKGLTMPSLSPTMTHGTISIWKSKPGDELKAGDILCEIETDKASVGFEMQDNCVLAKILVDAQGSEIACGIPIALTVDDMDDYAIFKTLDPSSYQHLIGSPVAAVPSSPVATTKVSSDPIELSTPTPPVAAIAPTSKASQQFSPAARHMVESKALDTTGLQGSAKRGLISKSDVVLGIKSGQVKEDDVKKKILSQALTKPVSTIAVTAPVIISPPAPIHAFPATTVNAATLLEISQKPANDRYVDIPNSNMRKVIAKRLTESKSTVPHFYTSIECEVDDLMKLRKRLQSDFDVNVSVNDLVIKSAALALRDVPRVNSKWSKQLDAIDSSMSHRVDISVAVATPNGLITPIVTDADKRGLADINSTVKDLATRARDGKLKPDEYQGGSFSISNLGLSSYMLYLPPIQ